MKSALKHLQIAYVCCERKTPTIFARPLPQASPLLIFLASPLPPPPSSQCSHPQSDIYFVSSAPVSSASNCSSRDTSSHSSPQTPTGYEMPVFPSPLGDGESQRRQDVDVTSLRFARLPSPNPPPRPASPPPADLFDFGTTLPTFICINFLSPAERFIEAAVFLLRSSCLRTADSPSSSARDLNKFFPPIVVVIIALRILLYRAFTPPD